MRVRQSVRCQAAPGGCLGRAVEPVVQVAQLGRPELQSSAVAEDGGVGQHGHAAGARVRPR